MASKDPIDNEMERMQAQESAAYREARVQELKRRIQENTFDLCIEEMVDGLLDQAVFRPSPRRRP